VKKEGKSKLQNAWVLCASVNRGTPLLVQSRLGQRFGPGEKKYGLFSHRGKGKVGGLHA